MRIASLLPSATEIVYALGLDEHLVGVTFECDYPPDPRQGRPVLVGGLATEGLSSSEIDALVRARAEAGENLYSLDEAAFRAAAPDLVLTQDLCRVCALPTDEVDRAMERLGCTAELVVLDPHTLQDVLDGILAVGRAAGVEERASAYTAGLRDRLAAVATRNAGRAEPRVFVLEWPDPPFLAGHWVPDLVTAAGGDAVLARSGQRSVPTTFEAIAEVDPDVVVVASCGFDLEGTAGHAADVLERLPARAAVWAVDANAVMVRPGPRLVDGVEVLAELLHGGSPDSRLARLIRPGLPSA